MTKVIIVGGGTAGWLTAGWLSKKNPNVEITLVESPDIPIIGVGESVTPHVMGFFREMGLETHNWMQSTGSIYKFANKFVNWHTGKGEFEYFSFNYTTDSKFLMRDIPQALCFDDWLSNNNVKNKTTDLVLDLIKDKYIDKFDKFFNPQYHYMQENTSPFEGNMYLLNAMYSQSQHINADLAAGYIRDKLAKPNGVNHIRKKITEVYTIGENTSKIILEDGTEVTGDIFIDCTGFKRLLTSKWKDVEYKDNPIDSAWVCQLDYSDPEIEMVNYTQSIAQNNGWLFKIGLYHRMGSGYCFSSSHISNEAALEEFSSMVQLQRKEPRLIKWKPRRLENTIQGNTCAIGLSAGFVEPMEANALYVIINSIVMFSKVLDGKMTAADANERINYSLDDIADFIKVHYTLSERSSNDFWKDMKEIGKKDNHVDLIYNKYHHTNNTMYSATTGYSLFPDYMWAQLATSWGINTTSWYTTPDQLTIELAKLYYSGNEKKHNLISKTRQNNYIWLKENVFNNMSPAEWERSILG